MFTLSQRGTIFLSAYMLLSSDGYDDGSRYDDGSQMRTGFLAPAEQQGYSITAREHQVVQELEPDMNPTQFLIISSPSLQKIVWTKLDNFESSKGRSFALVSTGLTRPKGIAVHKATGLLYIADPGASAIYRYQLVIDTEADDPQVATTGERLTILEGYPVEWVAVDDAGNLFFTSLDKNTINKIDARVIAKIASEEFKVEALKFVPEKTLEAKLEARNALLAASNSSEPIDEPPLKPEVLSLYDANATTHVSSPEALWVDGQDLYWSNTQEGTKVGTIVKGRVNPEHDTSPDGNSTGPIAFPVYAVTNSSMNAFGFARVGNKIFFSHCKTEPPTCMVKGLLTATGDVLTAVGQLTGPRGLAWDGDQTLYVADETGGNVWSFPTGRFMEHAPLSKAVSMQGAFGLVIISQADPCFAKQMFDGNSVSAAARQQRMMSHGFFQRSDAGGFRGHSVVLVAIAAVAYLHVAIV